jgi:hypothetical protein
MCFFKPVGSQLLLAEALFRICLPGGLQSIEQGSKFDQRFYGHLRRADHHVGSCRIRHPARNGGNDIARYFAVDQFTSLIVQPPMDAHRLAVEWVPRVINRYRAETVCIM